MVAKDIYGFHWQPDPALKPAITDAMYVLAPRPAIRVHVRPAQWVLDYAFEPAGLFQAGPEPCEWRPRLANTAHLYPPGTAYREDGRRAKRFHATFILFDAGEAAGLTAFVNSPLRFAEFTDPSGQLGNAIKAVAQIGRDAGEAGFWQAQSALFQIVNFLHQSHAVREGVWGLGSAPGFMRPQTLVEDVDRYLREHLADDITLASLARQLHISVSSLAHRYRHESGHTPLRRLADLRIAQAKHLLLLGQSLKAIAPAIGFCDPFHLSKTFKRVTGVSPRDFVLATRHPNDEERTG